jgi:hypothetical protein
MERNYSYTAGALTFHIIQANKDEKQFYAYNAGGYLTLIIAIVTVEIYLYLLDIDESKVQVGVKS